MTVDSTQPVSPKNPHSLKVRVANPGSGRAGVANNGFWGMAVAKGQTYELSLFARGGDGFTGPLTVSLESSNGIVYAQKTIPLPNCRLEALPALVEAQRHRPQGAPGHQHQPARARSGSTWCRSFPKQTWKNRPNGLRPDLAEMLAGLKPAFVRFPGGCWVEGDTMSQAYRWKQTIGDLSERRTQYNIWQYHATHGLGYHEYLQMCEDLGAEPLFVINCGMSHKEVVPLDKMGEFVQDALDAIEYANGPVTSTWGALRAKNGHPRAVQPEVPGDRQRERRPRLPRALRAVLRCHQGASIRRCT